VEIFFPAILLVGLALFLAFPFLATRALLQSTAQSFADPRRPEAARAVRRVARVCLAFSLVSGALISSWCYYQSTIYRPGGAWLDFGAELWFAGCFVPLWPILQVVTANSMPVRIRLFQSQQPELGFTRPR